MKPSRPAEADDQEGDDRREARQEREWCAGGEGERRACRGGWQDDPVRDPPLREVEECDREQRGAEHGETAERERRVRQRASKKILLITRLSCRDRKRLSRAGTRRHSLMFPR